LAERHGVHKSTISLIDAAQLGGTCEEKGRQVDGPEAGHRHAET
jgi:hypothetical protein